MSNNMISEAANQMAVLPYNLQKKVLNFIKELAESGRIGVPGRSLLRTEA